MDKENVLNDDENTLDKKCGKIGKYVKKWINRVSKLLGLKYNNDINDKNTLDKECGEVEKCKEKYAEKAEELLGLEDTNSSEKRKLEGYFTYKNSVISEKRYFLKFKFYYFKPFYFRKDSL